MKAHLFCLALCLVGGILLAQTSSTPKNDLELRRITGTPYWPSTTKMLCDPTNTTLSVQCDGETPINGDNNPENGAFMEWSATGSNLYYTRILSLTDTFEVFRPDFVDRTVFFPNEPDGISYSNSLAIGDNIQNDCIPEGIYTVQVWSVQDLDGNLLPDVDPATGAIIGCFVECSFEFRPSCASSTLSFFTVDARNIGCSENGGSVRLYDFRTENMYCIDNDGGGTTINWTGPGTFSATGPEITNLLPGIYSAEIMDYYGCTAYWDVNIVELDNVSFSCALRSIPTTVNGTDGSITIDIIAGLGDYNLYWTGPRVDSLLNITDGEVVIPNLPAGDYVFTVVDLESTCTEDCQVTISPPDCDDLSVNIVDQQNSDCDGGLNGRIEITFSGSFNPVLTWNGPGVDGSSLTTLEDLGPGTYAYTVVDSRNCSETGSIMLISEPSFNFNCGGVDETLPFLDDGLIGLSLTGGGSPPFVLSYVAIDQAGDSLPPVNNLIVTDGDTIRNLPAGAYFLEIVDQTGCTRTCVATIGEANCDIFPNCTPQDPLSVSGNGSVTLNFDSGPDWFITLSGPKDTTFVSSTPNVFLDDLPQGNYVVSVYNTEGCTGSCTFSIVPPPCTLSFNSSFSQPRCFANDDGRIALDINGAGAGLIVDWNVDAYDGRWVVNNLPAGTYIINISDQTQCPLEPDTIILTEPALLSVDLSQVDPILCFGDSTGSLLATVVGGTGAVVYDWSVDSLPGTATVDGLINGTYSVVVTDANGCQATDNIIITQPPLLTMNCSATAETIAGVMDGTVSVGNAGAVGVVMLSGDLGSFSLSANSDTTFTDLNPGTYDLIITDQNGCTTECSAIVNPGPCQIGLMTSTVQPDCDNPLGSATATPTNPFGPVSYQWSNGDTLAVADSLRAGSYRVTIVDASGCEATGRVIISPFTDTPGLTTSGITGVCDDGCTNLQLGLSGTPPFAINYAFSRPGEPEQIRTINRSTSGQESICPADLGLTSLQDVTLRLLDITDGNGCLRPIDRSLPVAVFPQAIGRLDTVLCVGQRLNIFGDVFDENRLMGQTVLPFPSVNGCDSTLLVNVQYFAPAFSAFDTTLCIGTQLNFFGQTFNNNRRSGSVIVPTPSAGGCDSTVLVTVDFFAPSISTLDTTLCPGQRLNYFGQIFHSNRTTGEVVVPTPSVNGCDSTVMVTVNFFPEAMGVLDTTICNYTRLFYFGQYFDINRPRGMVRLPIPSAAGCDSTVMVSVDFHPEVIGVLDTAICEGTTLQYGDVLFEGAANNVLTQLDIPDRYGCDSLVFVTVSTIPIPEVRISGDGIICPGGELEINFSYDGPGIATVILSSNPTERITLVAGSTTINRLVPAGSVVTIIDVTGEGPCPAISSGSITVRETDLAVNIDILSGDGVFAVSCADGSDGEVLAIPSGGVPPYTFQWNNGGENAELRNLPAGNYNVQVTSSRGCRAEARIGLTAPEILVSVLSEVDANCRDTLPSIILRDVQGGVSPYLFRIGNNSGFRPINNLPDTLLLPVGRSLLEVEDVNGCLLSETFTFGPPPLAEVFATPSRTIIAQGDSANIRVLTNLDVTGFQVSPWPDSMIFNDNFFVGPTENTTYQISVMDEFGCFASTMVEVIIDDFVPVYVPNVFTPNEDGVNDLFRLYARPRTVLNFSNFTIFNRWGAMVYHLEDTVSPTDASWGWDGFAPNGDINEQDVYIYKVKVQLLDGRTVELAGDVLLLR
ncbi:T9SS type B sorting domain-containing protein [Neolewinella persica]|uniref:T9SS type B sorting domain-containing protein n=1 Tax=Neolewinella persica TaxID=70998 RepID=UPI0005C44FE5|nr:gliding motility-associated C-terminal domain-containing protein [Neolewinella persica]